VIPVGADPPDLRRQVDDDIRPAVMEQPSHSRGINEVKIPTAWDHDRPAASPLELRHHMGAKEATSASYQDS
jgi:hypothetical protein